jgi:hypothetical protein
LIVLAGFIEIPQNIIIVPIPIKLSIYTQHYCPSMEEGNVWNECKAVVANKEKKQA